MSHDTKIQWCDATVNPTTGCDGCELFVKGKGGPCYAGNFHERRLAKSVPRLYDKSFTSVRLAPGRMAQAARWSDLTGTKRPNKPWLDGMPRMIFVSDMSDALSKDVPFDYLHDEIIANVTRWAPGTMDRRHIYLWLTKNPRRMAEFARWLKETWYLDWPDNLWAGTSLTSDMTTKRIHFLRRVPAKVRFLSVEPMWGPIDLSARLDGISWVICGGESPQRGFEPRPFNLGWARTLRDQCRAHDVPFYMKQLGAVPMEESVHGPRQTALVLRDSHGGDWNEWPEDLKIREVPRG